MLHDPENHIEINDGQIITDVRNNNQQNEDNYQAPQPNVIRRRISTKGSQDDLCSMISVGGELSSSSNIETLLHKTKYTLLMKGITWSRNSHGLFDYENNNHYQVSMQADIDR